MSVCVCVSKYKSVEEKKKNKGVKICKRGLTREKETNERKKERKKERHSKAVYFKEWDRKWGWRERKTEGAAA